ncbi:HAD-like domain-containing protein [Dunaliella salina]|nr:HAD-like domain-containing protein [Dunaliella salina]|eukprot:KAF5839585.1 HAD-like domain-containing protein [Dunaliella salina]
MEEYGSAGLRTLCLSYAELDPAFYAQWQTQFMQAKTSMQDRDEKVAAVAELIEKNLQLLGCTAIEDKLQEGVPQCIKQLACAGVKLWVLTGDKMETAINIAFACSLITEEMQQFEADELEAAGRVEEADMLCNSRIQQQLAKVEATMSEQEGSCLQYALVIDGKALSYALSDKLAPTFLKVGVKCLAVVCCRVSPLQKAQVTMLVSKAGDVTLAIGDGANDVGMIQAAHLGVGISGQEGMQAVMSSDFAIAQFRFLTILLLVHGRLSYFRLSRMICFFLYKNLMFGVTIFIFNAFALFSGQFMYNDFYMTLFNILFTSLMPLAIGIFDRDVDRKKCIKYPSMYKQGGGAVAVAPPCSCLGQHRLLFPTVQDIVREAISMDKRTLQQIQQDEEHEMKGFKPEILTKNTGFVPPYDRNSRHYRPVASSRQIYNPKDMQHRVAAIPTEASLHQDTQIHESQQLYELQQQYSVEPEQQPSQQEAFERQGPKGRGSTADGGRGRYGSTRARMGSDTPSDYVIATGPRAVHESTSTSESPRDDPAAFGLPIGYILDPFANK